MKYISLLSVFSITIVIHYFLRLIAYPFPRKNIVFFGHQGHYSGNAKFVFEHINKTIPKLRSRTFFLTWKGSEVNRENVYCMADLKLWEKARILLGAKVLVITTPGWYWKQRFFLSAASKKILLSNGFPLKSPGLLSKNFDRIKKLKYYFYWRDISIVVTSSTFESYLASSSLRLNIYKFKVLGSARQCSLAFSLDKEAVQRKMLQNILSLSDTNTKLVLYAPTHRDFQSDIGDPLFELINMSSKDFIYVNSFLRDNNITLILRAHYLGSLSLDLSKYNNIKYMNADIISDLTDVIHGFNSYLTDYSGFYLDLLDVKKNIGLLRLKNDDFISKRGLVVDEHILNLGTKISTIDQLLGFISANITQKQFDKNKSFKKLFFEVGNNNALNNNVEFIKELYEQN